MSHPLNAFVRVNVACGSRPDHPVSIFGQNNHRRNRKIGSTRVTYDKTTDNKLRQRKSDGKVREGNGILRDVRIFAGTGFRFSTFCFARNEKFTQYRKIYAIENRLENWCAKKHGTENVLNGFSDRILVALTRISVWVLSPFEPVGSAFELFGLLAMWWKKSPPASLAPLRHWSWSIMKRALGLIPPQLGAIELLYEHLLSGRINIAKIWRMRALLLYQVASVSRMWNNGPKKPSLIFYVTSNFYGNCKKILNTKWIKISFAIFL